MHPLHSLRAGLLIRSKARHTWDMMGRGIEAAVITDLNQPWGESRSCTRCGKCVQVCPTAP